MPTSVQVHGLPEPPEGCEWHTGYPKPGEAHKTVSIVARRKWEPKPGEAVFHNGRKYHYLGNLAEFGSNGQWAIALYSPDSDAIIMVKPREITGPWVEEAAEKSYGSNGGVACDTADGPCSCGAWHDKLVDNEPEPLAIGDRVKVLPKGDDPLGLWKGTEYRNCGKFGVVSHVYATREFSVRFDGPDNTWAYSRCQLEKLPAETEPEPVWTTPDWAKEMGWMTQDKDSKQVEFRHLAKPEFFNGVVWAYGIGVKDFHDVRFMSVELAKALNLYPPHWDRLPASERCVKLGGE